MKFLTAKNVRFARILYGETRTVIIHCIMSNPIHIDFGLIFGIWPTWVEICMHTKFQPDMLPGRHTSEINPI